MLLIEVYRPANRSLIFLVISFRLEQDLDDEILVQKKSLVRQSALSRSLRCNHRIGKRWIGHRMFYGLSIQNPRRVNASLPLRFAGFQISCGSDFLLQSNAKN